MRPGMGPRWRSLAPRAHRKGLERHAVHGSDESRAEEALGIARHARQREVVGLQRRQQRVTQTPVFYRVWTEEGEEGSESGLRNLDWEAFSGKENVDRADRTIHELKKLGYVRNGDPFHGSPWKR